MIERVRQEVCEEEHKLFENERVLKPEEFFKNTIYLNNS